MHETETYRSSASRFASTITMVIIVLGITAGLIVAAGRWTRHEPVKRVRLIGRKTLDSSEIMRYAALTDSAKLESVDLSEVERRVASHPFVSAASVYRGEQGTLIVELKERAPQAVTFVNGSAVYFDSSAVPMPCRGTASAFDVPVLSGVVVGGHADTARVREAIRIAMALRNYDNALYRQISEIHRGEDGQFTLICVEDGLPVSIGDTTAIEGRLPKLYAFWKNVLSVPGNHDIRSVDIRWQGQVVVKKS